MTGVVYDVHPITENYREQVSQPVFTLGDFNILDLKLPDSLERYIEAVNLCVKHIIIGLVFAFFYIFKNIRRLTIQRLTNSF